MNSFNNSIPPNPSASGKNQLTELEMDFVRQAAREREQAAKEREHREKFYREFSRLVETAQNAVEQAHQGKDVPRFISSRDKNETVSQFIDRACAERSWKIPDLAQKAGINEAQIYRIKNEEGVNSATLTSVADALGCLVDDLLLRRSIGNPSTP